MQSGPDDKSGGRLNIASKFACESGPMGFYPGGARFWDFTVFVKRSVAESPKLQNDPNLLSEELDLPDMQFLRSHFVFCPVRDNDGSALQLKISLHAPTFFGISAHSTLVKSGKLGKIRKKIGAPRSYLFFLLHSALRSTPPLMIHNMMNVKLLC